MEQDHQPLELRHAFGADCITALPVIKHNRIQIEAIPAIVQLGSGDALVDRKFGRLPRPVALKRRLCRVALKQVTDPVERDGFRCHAIAARLINRCAVRGELGRNLEFFEACRAQHSHNRDKQQHG